jgi:predicted methyltransferase
MEYDIDMKHKPGRMMVIPDNLSRNFVEYAETEQDFETKKLQDLLYKALGRKPMYENRELIENEKEMQKQEEDGIE